MSHLQPEPQLQIPQTKSVLQGLSENVAQDLQNRSLQHQSLQHQSLQHHSVTNPNHSQLNTSGLKLNSPAVQPIAAQHTSVVMVNPPGANTSTHNPDRSQLNNSALAHNTSINRSVNRSIQNAQNRSVMNTSHQQPAYPLGVPPPGTTVVTTTTVTSGLPIPPVHERVSFIGQRVYSPGLKAIFWLSFLLLLNEMLMMLTKYHFFGVMVALTIMSLFFLRYFEGTFNKVVLGMVVLSIVLDIVWVVNKLKNQGSFREFASPFAMVPPMVHIGVNISLFFSIILKVVLAVLLFGFRSIETGDAYCIEVFGYEMVMTQAVDSSANHFNSANSAYQPVIH